MKYREFEAELKKIGYTCKESTIYLSVRDKCDREFVLVDIKNANSLEFVPNDFSH